MQKYWAGGVSALISQTKPSNVSGDANEDDNSKRTKKKKKAELYEKVHENEVAECEESPAPSVSEKNVKEAKGLGKKRRKNKHSDDVTDEPSIPVPDVSRKKRKTVPDELKPLESNTVNTGLDNPKQKCNLRVNNQDEVEGSEKCKKDDESNEINNVAEKSDNSQKKKRLKRKKEISDDVDKSEYTVFVGNLPLSYDHKKVVKLFNKFGKVESARIRCIPVAKAGLQKKTSAITKKFHPSRNSAVAYVVFKSKESVVQATAQNGMILDGHHLRIDSVVSQKRDPNKSVFVGGLPFDIKDDELWDLFKDCGEIENVRVIRDKDVSMGKGFGYVNFKSIASVELALQLNGREIKNNRKINVERCVQKKKKGNPATPTFSHKKKKRKHERSGGGEHRKKSNNRSSSNDFQGRMAEKKAKKKKINRSKDAVRRNRIKSAFLPPSKGN